MFEKLHKKKFPKAVHKIKDTLDYIHSECWDPSKLELLKGHMYFVYRDGNHGSGQRA